MEELFKKLNIKPKNIEIYKDAFSHSSYSNEHKGKINYERLEFLGDAVLDLVMADYLYNHFEETEGEMTKVRASYVCENANYEYAKSLNLNDYILVGNGEIKEGGRFKKAIVADIFESFIGAIYTDLGYEEAKRVVLEVIVPFIENPKVSFFSDYKSALQEYVQTELKSLEYKLIKEEGPPHDKTFTTEVLVDNIVFGTGVGNSKKEAEQEAAKEALNKLAL